MAKEKTKNPTPETEPETLTPETPDGEASGSSVADLETITQTLIDASPEPNSAAIGAHAEKEETTKAQFSHLRDNKGGRFDPELHVTDDNGQPKLTKHGKLRLRPGRKSTETPKDGNKLPGIGPDKGLTARDRMQARMAGEGAANALITLGVVLGGDEWQPITDEPNGLDERANLSGAFGDYFEAKEMTDIPPGVALTIAVSAYALPRFTMPHTKTRMQKLKEWIAVKIAKRKTRKKEKTNGALADSGNDRKRKDDNSEKDSS